MITKETQEYKKQRLDAIASFIQGNYTTPKEVALILKKIMDSFAMQITALEGKINNQNENRNAQDIRFRNSFNQSVNSIVKSQEQLSSSTSSIASKMNLRIDSVAESVRELERKVNLIPSVNENGLVQHAIEKAYTLIKPLIPKEETNSSIRAKWENTLANDKIDAKDIKNLEENIDGRKIKNLPPPQVIHHTERIGGFIETPLKAGSNISLSKDGSGATVITATGSAGGGVGSWSTPPESPASDGSVTQFTVGSSAPTDVNADGIIYPSGTAWSYSAGTQKITMTIGGSFGPTQFIRFR